LCGVGEIGEIYFRSPHLAKGYLEDDDSTRNRFVMNPFSNLPGDILYRTGDLGRYRPDGNVEFAGRRDQQVKIRGYRIEPAEIEAALARHPGVRAALVRPYESQSMEKCLVAYIIPEQGPQPGVSELRNHVSKRLPDYMVPASYVFVEALPLTP